MASLPASAVLNAGHRRLRVPGYPAPRRSDYKSHNTPPALFLPPPASALQRPCGAGAATPSRRSSRGLARPRVRGVKARGGAAGARASCGGASAGAPRGRGRGPRCRGARPRRRSRRPARPRAERAGRPRAAAAPSPRSSTTAPTPSSGEGGAGRRRGRRGVAAPRGGSAPRDPRGGLSPPPRGHGLPGVQPPPLAPGPSPGRAWPRSHLRAAFPDLAARSPPLPCVLPLSLTARMSCEVAPCSPGEWGNIRAARHAGSPADECGGKALPVLSGPAPGQPSDPCTPLTRPRLGSGRPLACLHGGHGGRGSQKQRWRSAWAELGASAFEGPGSQPWVNRSQAWLEHLTDPVTLGCPLLV